MDMYKICLKQNYGNSETMKQSKYPEHKAHLPYQIKYYYSPMKNYKQGTISNLGCNRIFQIFCKYIMPANFIFNEM